MSHQPGVQLKIQKRQQQGRGNSGKRYVQCPNCKEYYVRSMYIPVRSHQGKMKWIKIGVYCEGCGMTWTERRKEHEISHGIDVSDYPF